MGLKGPFDDVIKGGKKKNYKGSENRVDGGYDLGFFGSEFRHEPPYFSPKYFALTVQDSQPRFCHRKPSKQLYVNGCRKIVDSTRSYLRR